MNPMEALLSRSLDEPLDAEARARLDAALASSPELRALERDLRTLKRLAGEETEAVPRPEVLTALEARVAQRYATRRFRVIPGGWVGPVLAAAALFVLVLLGVQQVGQPNEGVADPSMDIAREEVLAAQARFHRAIGRLENLAMVRLGELPPEVARGYAHNLEVINAAIADCERLAGEAPENTLNFLALSQAYDAKVVLLELILAG